MKTSAFTEAQAQKESTRKLLSAGWKDGEITDALEKPSKRGNDMIELSVMIRDAQGNEERSLRDWLTNTSLGAAKLRHACAAVGALAKYEAGEIGRADFPGHTVRVKIGIKKNPWLPGLQCHRGLCPGRGVPRRPSAGARIVSERSRFNGAGLLPLSLTAALLAGCASAPTAPSFGSSPAPYYYARPTLPVEPWAAPPAGLARISQRCGCIGTLDLRKSCCENGLSRRQGEPDADRV